MAKQNKIQKVSPDEQALATVDYGEYAGNGMENVTGADVTIPFLGIVQDLSPQKQEGDPKFIQGAKVGDLFNTVTNELYGQSVHIVPCCKDSVYVEWVPRDQGGGFVAIHELNSDVVRTAKDNSTDQFKLKTENGNDLVETHYVYGMLIHGPEGKTSETPIVIAFTSSKIKVYRSQLMTRIRTMKGNPPMFAFRFKVSSLRDKNKQGQPYSNFKIEPACGSMTTSINLPGSDYHNLLVEGKALVEAVRGGTAKAAHESQVDNTEVSDGDTPF